MKRTEVLRKALESGLYLETNYEWLLPGKTSGAELANARWTADNVILLPLYSGLRIKDARRIAKEMNRIAGAQPASRTR
jgi:dTDP-4-amino-4,6-dideoxygalactose transaminase